MKLLYCYKCKDIFSLDFCKIKSCSCGSAMGFYFSELHIIYTGYGVPLGIDNNELKKGIFEKGWRKSDKKDSPDIDVHAWIIPMSAPHAVWIENRYALPKIKRKALKYYKYLNSYNRKEDKLIKKYDKFIQSIKDELKTVDKEEEM